MIDSQRFKTILAQRCAYDANPGSKATTVPRRAQTLAAISEKAPTFAPTSYSTPPALIDSSIQATVHGSFLQDWARHLRSIEEVASRRTGCLV
jgi:hypothetical protein